MRSEHYPINGTTALSATHIEHQARIIDFPGAAPAATSHDDARARLVANLQIAAAIVIGSAIMFGALLIP